MSFREERVIQGSPSPADKSIEPPTATSHGSAGSDKIAQFFAGLLGLIFVALRWRGFSHPAGRPWIVLGITLLFAWLAWMTRGVDLSGAFAGAVIAFIMASRDLRLFAILLLIFTVTLAATRVKRNRKIHLKLASRRESKNGRSAAQVMANLGVAGLLLSLPQFDLWLVPVLAALAELAADTTSSEIGAVLGGRTLLITSWRTVTPGTDGGISLVGTGAAILSSTVVAMSALALRLVSPRGAAVVVASAVLGMMFDSLLGATLERRGRLNNNMVNLLGTASAATLGWLL
ncbi:MAG TPA: DUF92 domain-containing protein [Candidatus Angelobacter sp.]|nr:DUF92 domain-containing protein [Candidatus Angelobacter sp.]